LQGAYEEKKNEGYFLKEKKMFLQSW